MTLLESSGSVISNSHITLFLFRVLDGRNTQLTEKSK